MYTAFYGLEEKPFTLSPDPKYLFLSETHREVLGHLIYGIEQGEGFICISGEVGTGKTTLCRTLLERLGNDTEVAFLFNPQLAPHELLQAINTDFGLPASSESLTELTRHLNDFLVSKKIEGRRVLLIVDEAQTLSPDTLEQIRLLSNLETSRAKLLQIVLLGQPELDQKLSLTELRQLRQRISVWWRLGPMTAAETRAYVLHRLRIAGARQTLFSDAALTAVHKVSRGVPRIINVVCDRALLAGYGDGRTQIDRDLVQQVAREIGPSARTALARPWRQRLFPFATGLLVLALGFAAGRYLGGQTDSGLHDVAQQPLPQVAAAPPQVFPKTPIGAIDATLPDEPSATRTATPSVDPASDDEETSVIVVGPVSRLASELPTIDLPAPTLRSDVLDTLLPSRSAIETTASAVDATLAAWRLPESGTSRLYMADALHILNERGLRSLWIERTNLEALQNIDLPVLVQLEASVGTPRWALLRRVSPQHLELEGLVPGEAVRVPHQPFLERWTGRGYVIWRDFEGLPRGLNLGVEGRGVEWLQRALADLGYLDGNHSGVLDATTTSAVREFQRAAAIPADGIVGAKTMIRLYQALPGYVAPSLGGSLPDLASHTPRQAPQNAAERRSARGR